MNDQQPHTSTLNYRINHGMLLTREAIQKLSKKIFFYFHSTEKTFSIVFPYPEICVWS